MKSTLTIPYIKAPFSANDVPSGAVTVPINFHNWNDKFPYTPEAEARLWHDGENLYLNYKVSENHVAALAKEDKGEVWKDSCAEFFIAFDDNGYYNLEANCIGKVLLSHRKERKVDVEQASPEIFKKITRVPSLGTEPFECRPSNESWTLALTIPATSFFKHNLKSFCGADARANFYKCGDNLPNPHFMSWKPVETENPDFHRPEFFAPIHFEDSKK